MKLDQSITQGDRSVAIAVPVRNEADRLPGLLAALAGQREAPPFTLCLFLNSCSDDSAQVVASLADQLPYPVVTQQCDRHSAPNAGHARVRAVTLALANAPAGVILTTDADGEPANDWVAANVAALDRADIVAGRIVRGPGAPSPVQDRIERYLDRLHALRRAIDPVNWDDDQSHHWTSAASLAMRAQTYRALGGFPPITCGEDAALGDAAARAGYSLRRDARVVVTTSARRDGRAVGGFAASLAGHDMAGCLPAIAHPGDEAWRFAMQATARAMHGSDTYDELVDSLGLPPLEVERVAGECRNGEAFAARIVGAPAGGMRTVSLDDAERLLIALEAMPLVQAA